MEVDPRKKHRLLVKAGLSNDKLASIGAIAVLASHTEHYAERAIWRIEGQPVTGVRPRTDARPISQLIEILDEIGPTAQKPGIAPLVEQWCRSATLCFSCRNSIMHGTTAYADEDFTVFARNLPTDGVRRKRNPSDFYASQNTLTLLVEAFENLLGGIHLIWLAAQTTAPLGDIKEPMSALRRAWSIGAELDNLRAAIHHEKY
ncbi:hypothetical protein [Rhizobium leguminosarum]|uniref:hypothetical protein n=1 Tax=Rhizobium leguminosarum TaxID=384 RepID=UPI000FEC4DD9|nr:hypothetical protein [Rhizobium leguminosarum]MBY5666215.1 hypothetical protein [Rhizobium leguminosarum]MBY5679513.1 hypothetical protein [Rhizobium leguminosarum]RWX33214.1 hypothetical protein EHI43_15195 [Rhizobium leguminosarum]